MSTMSGDDASAGRTIWRFLLNFIARHLLAGVLVYCCWIPIQNYNYWFTWHVVLCTLGLIPFMTEALFLFAGDEIWNKKITKSQRNWIHAGLMTLGSVLVIAGSADIIYYTAADYHFNTIHGVTGLISMILIIFSLFLGIFANYAQSFKGLLRPVTLKFDHNLIGLLGYIIGIVSLCYSYYTHWFVFFTTKESRIVALVATILGTLWTLNNALVSGYNQLRAMTGH